MSLLEELVPREPHQRLVAAATGQRRPLRIAPAAVQQALGIIEAQIGKELCVLAAVIGAGGNDAALAGKAGPFEEEPPEKTEVSD